MTDYIERWYSITVGGLTLLAMLFFSTAALGALDEEQVAQQLREAADLFADKQYQQAAEHYLSLTEAENVEQASWALELYGVCLEKQYDLPGATAVYQQWLQRYAGSSGEMRVQQRLLALETAAMQPRQTGRTLASGANDTVFYGSASLMYRGLTREVDGQDRETALSALAGDVDLHFQSRSGDWAWRGRANGGYLIDESDRGDSDGRVGNLYLGVTHEPSGAELLVGRRRSADTGIYGYLDGASFNYPVNDSIAFSLIAGTTSTSSRESSENDRMVYALGAEFTVPDSAMKFQFYMMEQDYDGLTERRAVGGQFSYFNDTSRHFMVLDYDIKFRELNNVMYNGNWDISHQTNLALSLGYQRSPFLSARNAIIGEYDTDLDDYLERLEDGQDIYDAALDKTALNQYGSLVLNRELSNGHRIIGEIYHFELSDLPRYDFSPDAPDSEANTTFGLQYIWTEALFQNDTLSMGVRYTDGDLTESTTLFLDEKFYLDHGLNLVLRMRASQRTVTAFDQDALTLRPGIRLDWYITPDLLLETELGYEWLAQDFGENDFEVQQGFVVLGLRKRF